MHEGERQNRHREEDVIEGRIDHLIERRIPWIILGLCGGLFATFIVSRYETILAADVRLSFFIPIIVYLSDAVGTQTETIYVRALSGKKKIDFARYIFKESVVGFGLGIVSGIVFGIFASYWLGSYAIGLAVGMTMLINLTSAPILAVAIPNILYRRHADPALGSGPLATIVQDMISLLVYFIIAGIVIF